MNIKSSLRDWFGALAAAFALLPALPAFAQEAPFSAELAEIQQAWDQANYQSGNAAEKQRQLEELSVRSEALALKYPRRAEPLVWQGIVLSSYAGAKGGLGALSLARKSRDVLLEAARIDPAALRGSAYTSLGALYYKVPGWPVGFGDHDQASDFLHKALALNPDGIDPNYFIGELLFEDGNYALAIQHLQKALAAPARPDRPLADAGRRAEINTLLAKVRSKMK
jgi:tetratricopeptide (TPR) repeat protein